VSTTGAVALTLVVLALAGALPVLVLVGPRLVAVPLLPLAGAVLCGLSAVCSVALFGSMVMWFVLWSLAAAAAGLGLLVRRPDRARHLVATVRRGIRPLMGVAAGALLVAVGWTLRTLRVPNVGFDTRAIWILHARWLSQGHAFALAALRNHFLVLSHPGYPPLVSAVMALAWWVSGTGTDRVAVVMVAMLNACALLVAGWCIVEAARRGAQRLHAGVRPERVLIGVGLVVAVLAVLVAGGVLGTFATNGYADPLWSLAAVVAVVYGLVLPATASDLGVAAIMVGVAGLTKVEGTAVAMLLVVLIAIRLSTRRRNLGKLPLAAAAAGVVALFVWPLLTLLLGAPTDPSLTGSQRGSLAGRAHRTLNAMAPHLEIVLLAALCSVAGYFLLRRVRERLNLGNDLWAWAALLGATTVLGGAYVVGPGNVELWLATSVDRTTIFVALLGWWILALWAVCGSAGASIYGPLFGGELPRPEILPVVDRVGRQGEMAGAHRT
jgi:hypothetical protein